MALDALRCNHLSPLGFKGLKLLMHRSNPGANVPSASCFRRPYFITFLPQSPCNVSGIITQPAQCRKKNDFSDITVHRQTMWSILHAKSRCFSLPFLDILRRMLFLHGCPWTYLYTVLVFIDNRFAKCTVISNCISWYPAAWMWVTDSAAGTRCSMLRDVVYACLWIKCYSCTKLYIALFYRWK